MEQIRKLCPDPVIYDIEYMCRFPEGSGSLLDTSLLQFYIPSSEIVFRDYFMGIDFGRTKDGTVITVIGRMSDSKIYLCEIISLHNLEYSKQLEIIKNTYEKYHPLCVYGDNGGLGNPLMEQLNKEVSSRIKGFNFTVSSKTPAYEYLRT